MSLADDLYREIILDHYKSPRNRGRLPSPTIAAEGANPLCGDELALHLDLENGTVREARFEGRGCSISQASASMMTEQITGKPLSEVERLIGAFKAMMHGQGVPDAADLGDLEALEGVRQYPVRIKCALLAWTTLQEGLQAYRAREKG